MSMIHDDIHPKPAILRSGYRVYCGTVDCAQWVADDTGSTERGSGSCRVDGLIGAVCLACYEDILQKGYDERRERLAGQIMAGLMANPTQRSDGDAVVDLAEKARLAAEILINTLEGRTVYP